MPIFGNSLRGTLGYLPADLIEQLVLRRERDRSLRLDLQQHLTGMRCSVDHQIVKRKALIYALVTNPLDERSGQPARLDIGEERQQLDRTKLGFDVGAGAAACGRPRLMTDSTGLVTVHSPSLSFVAPGFLAPSTAGDH